MSFEAKALWLRGLGPKSSLVKAWFRGFSLAPFVGNDPVAAVLAFVLCLVLVVATWSHGAFFQPQASIFLGVSLVLVAVVISRFGVTVLRREDVSLFALSIWWLISAELHHEPRSFLPLGASLTGILAGSLVTGELGVEARRTVTACVVAIGSLTALVGLIACDLRWFPLAMRGQNVWRLAGSLTYSNAAGLLIAIALVLCLASNWRHSWRIASLELCSAGLVATESRGALLAMTLAAAIFLRANVRQALVPLVMGLCAGIVTIAGARGHSPSFGALTGSCLILVAGYVWSRRRASTPPPGSTNRTRRIGIAIGIAIAVAATGFVARPELERRLSSGSALARLSEWRLALQQFRTSPWLGVGPDKVLIPRTGGVASYLAHNEYLQILAGAGLVGATLLLSTLILAGHRLWHHPRDSNGPLSAVLIFALGGAFDYTWHVPALGLCAGIALGLATNPKELNAASAGGSSGPPVIAVSASPPGRSADSRAPSKVTLKSETPST